MAVSPAVALASCASMGADAEMAMEGMAAGDCDSMGENNSQTHDAGCVAACALVCPGFYAGIDYLYTDAQTFSVVQFSMPSVDSIFATPSHLDPPPPRI